MTLQKAALKQLKFRGDSGFCTSSSSLLPHFNQYHNLPSEQTQIQIDHNVNTQKTESKIYLKEVINGRERFYLNHQNEINLKFFWRDENNFKDHNELEKKNSNLPFKDLYAKYSVNTFKNNTIKSNIVLQNFWNKFKNLKVIQSSNLKFFKKIFFFEKIVQWWSQMFLPVGYPNTCHEVYATVHIWQFIETFLGSTVSVLCNQAMLSSIGLSQSEATGGAVAIQWVLKDGFGEIGKLFFIQQFSKNFDSHPKTWKLVGEVSCLFGSTLQLITVLTLNNYFLIFASVGYAFRSIHFSIWGATHMTFTKNFSLTGNVADLVAKDDSQMSVAHLLGMLCGVGLISISHDPNFLFVVFFIVAPLHFLSTNNLLKSANFKVLNKANLTILSRSFINSKKLPSDSDLNRNLIFFGEFLKKEKFFSLKKKCKKNIDFELSVEVKNLNFSNIREVEFILNLYENEKYLLKYDKTKNKVGVSYFDGAVTNDVLKSIFNAVTLIDLISSSPTDLTYNGTSTFDENLRNKDLKQLSKKAFEATNLNFESFLQTLKNNGWKTDEVFFGDNGYRLKKID
ncbi:hypothetical protein HDU92_003097 [Lobulomyces angularis]|nr:hypothetical protein HDU92_003097 [Lobulomyces angularis]